MLFNSFHFLVFFPIAVGVYFALPHRHRWIWLLACSYYFYMAWQPVYVLVIWLLTAIDYVAGLAIGGARSRARRRLFLGLSITSNLALLFVFKYFNFFNGTVAQGAAAVGLAYDPPLLDIVLPIGVSFHTFQALSYTIDVFRGRQEPERHLGRFALFIAFFPQLVAGPIERAGHMLPQLRAHHAFDATRVSSGLMLMLWGFFKKVVIADRLAVYVNSVYGAPERHDWLQLVVATYFFAFQIYCDFSGYSDIAVGSAQVMGFELTTNFRRPYLAGSIREFWQRWHISLSTWFRDYVYIGLGGNRVGPVRKAVNVMVVFLVSGLWHGANWTYVVWGGLHGSYLVAGDWTSSARESIARVAGFTRNTGARRAVAILATFHLVTFAWIFFRAQSVEQAHAIIRRIAAGIGTPATAVVPGFDGVEIAMSVALIVFLLAVELVQERGALRPRIVAWPAWARWTCYYAAVASILLLGRFDERQFVYFQF
jgi:D-alanyl-lipoteichoic acid acyltransferase DltB (MBOAT superfamily)